MGDDRRLAARPLRIAHRAGNSPARLQRAEALGVELVEADVWLHRGRLEVRHEKTAGPLPVLWDRWSLGAGWGPRWGLSDLLRAAGPETLLLLDLKGWNPHLPERVLTTLRAEAPGRPFAVCSQRWELLERFRDEPLATRFYSVGNRRQLAALPARLKRAGRQAVSIDARLLDPATVAAIKERAWLVVPWRVRSLDQAGTLLAWGVDGINADDLDLLRDLVTDVPESRLL